MMMLTRPIKKNHFNKNPFLETIYQPNPTAPMYGFSTLHRHERTNERTNRENGCTRAHLTLAFNREDPTH